MNLRKTTILLFLLVAGGAKAASDVPYPEILDRHTLGRHKVNENGNYKLTPEGELFFFKTLSLQECQRFVEDHPEMLAYVDRQQVHYEKLAKLAAKSKSPFPSEKARYLQRAEKCSDVLNQTQEDSAEKELLGCIRNKDGNRLLNFKGEQIFRTLPLKSRVRFLSQNPDLTPGVQSSVFDYREAAQEWLNSDQPEKREKNSRLNLQNADIFQESLERLDQITDLNDCIRDNKGNLEFNEWGTILFASRPLEECTDFLLSRPGLLTFARTQFSINRNHIQELRSKQSPLSRVMHFTQVLAKWQASLDEVRRQTLLVNSVVEEEQICVENGTRKFTAEGLKHFAIQTPQMRMHSLMRLKSWQYAKEQAEGQGEDAELFAQTLQALEDAGIKEQ